MSTARPTIASLEEARELLIGAPVTEYRTLLRSVATKVADWVPLAAVSTSSA